MSWSRAAAIVSLSAPSRRARVAHWRGVFEPVDLVPAKGTLEGPKLLQHPVGNPGCQLVLCSGQEFVVLSDAIRHACKADRIHAFVLRDSGLAYPATETGVGLFQLDQRVVGAHRVHGLHVNGLDHPAAHRPDALFHLHRLDHAHLISPQTPGLRDGP